jgi:hypothetical protein
VVPNDKVTTINMYQTYILHFEHNSLIAFKFISAVGERPGSR